MKDGPAGDSHRRYFLRIGRVDQLPVNKYVGLLYARRRDQHRGRSQYRYYRDQLDDPVLPREPGTYTITFTLYSNTGLWHGSQWQHGLYGHGHRDETGRQPAHRAEVQPA
jgi:hypothetical protein